MGGAGASAAVGGFGEGEVVEIVGEGIEEATANGACKG